MPHTAPTPPSFVRGAILTGYESLARRCGLDPAMLLRRVGLQRRDVRLPDQPLRSRKVFQLLELSAAVSGRYDFGLMLPEGRRLSYLGSLGLRMREQPTLRAALLEMADHMNMHNTGIDFHLEERTAWADLCVAVHPDGELALRQGTEAALAGLVHLLRLFLGRTWHPVHVQFMHAMPQQTQTHKRLFACPLTFSAPRNAVSLLSADLNREVPLSDTGFNGYAPPGFGAQLGAPPTPEQVRQILFKLLESGQCTSEQVAASMGMHRRTLHRLLAREGLSYMSVLQGLRRELAPQYLVRGDMPVADVAALLGFNDSTAFSRWCRQHLGSSPRALRANDSTLASARARSLRHQAAL